MSSDAAHQRDFWEWENTVEHPRIVVPAWKHGAIKGDGSVDCAPALNRAFSYARWLKRRFPQATIVVWIGEQGGRGNGRYALGSEVHV